MGAATYFGHEWLRAVLPGSSEFRRLVRVLSAIGLVGFALAFVCHRALMADLEALDDARRPVLEMSHTDPVFRS